MWCRPCSREHSGPECPIDERGEPNPAPNIERVAPAVRNATLWLGSMTTNTTVAGNYVNITYQHGTPVRRPPDDDGLAGVPALRR